MGIRIGRRLEELAARLGQNKMGSKKKAPESSASSPSTSDSSEQKPRRRLVRDIETEQEQKKEEERVEKEARRAAAKQQTAAQSSAQKYVDERTIHDALENTEGSHLQKKRLDKEAKDRKKLAKASRADLGARVSEDREKRMEKIYAYEAEQKAHEAELEKIKRDEQKKIDELHKYFEEGDYIKLAGNGLRSGDVSLGNDTVADEADNDELEEYDDMDTGPKHIGLMKSAQIEEDASPRKDRPRARKTGVKPETHHVASPAEQKQQSRREEKDDHDENEDVKRVRRLRKELTEADKDLESIRHELDVVRGRMIIPYLAYLKEYYIRDERRLLAQLDSIEKIKQEVMEELVLAEKKIPAKRGNGSIGAEPDYTAPEWVKFFEEAEARQQEKEKADAEDLHEIYEVLFDFYEGKDGKKGISAIDVNEIIFETEDNEIASKRYRNRWENITNPVVLEYPNSKGEKFGDILNRYLDMVFSFYRDNLDELQRSGAVDQHTDLPTMAQSALREIIGHGDTYNSSLNIPLTKTSPSYEFGQVVDPVIRYVDDACMKLEEHFDTRILNKLRTRLTDPNWRLYMKGLKLLNDLYEERQRLLLFRKRSQVAHQ